MNDLWESEAFLKRVDDINGYFIECFTEMPDQEMEKLKDLIVNDKREEGWKLIRTRIEEYCSHELPAPEYDNGDDYDEDRAQELRDEL